SAVGGSGQAPHLHLQEVERYSAYRQGPLCLFHWRTRLLLGITARQQAGQPRPCYHQRSSTQPSGGKRVMNSTPPADLAEAYDKAITAATAPAAIGRQLTHKDRCDQCGAQAWVQTESLYSNLGLHWCA